MEENAFFTPRVPERYLAWLGTFWVLFGVGYAANDRWDPLGVMAILRKIEAND